jgi:hypothetical protein
MEARIEEEIHRIGRDPILKRRFSVMLATYHELCDQYMRARHVRQLYVIARGQKYESCEVTNHVGDHGRAVEALGGARPSEWKSVRDTDEHVRGPASRG